MAERWRGPALLAAAIACAGLGAPALAGEDAATADPLLARVATERSERRFSRCEGSAALLLNEVCSVGVECDDDVRVADFVEVYNDSDDPVDLACYALFSRDGGLFLPSGTLEAAAVKAWGEGQLGFRLSKREDAVELYAIGMDLDGEPVLRLLDSVEVDAERSHRMRVPDGGAWLDTASDAAERERPASFDESNGLR